MLTLTGYVVPKVDVRDDDGADPKLLRRLKKAEKKEKRKREVRRSTFCFIHCCAALLHIICHGIDDCVCGE